jgi:hypothetical protein
MGLNIWIWGPSSPNSGFSGYKKHLKYTNWNMIVSHFIGPWTYAKLFIIILHYIETFLTLFFLFYMCRVLENFRSIFSYIIPFDSHRVL